MAQLTAEDLQALDAIAEIDDSTVILEEEEESTSADSGFGSGDDSLFDFVEDDGEWLPDPVERRETSVLGEGTRVDADEDRKKANASRRPTTEQNNGLKRNAAVYIPQEDSLNEKPAKLNKSFSDGLDEAFGRVSLDTVPDEETPVARQGTARPSSKQTSDNEIEAQLAIEEEIKKTTTAERLSKSPKISLPDFVIPAEVLQQAIASNKNGYKSYWSHTLYRGPHDRRVTLHYCRTREESERVAKSFLDEPAIGFDMEWCTQWDKSLSGLKRQVSLIQIASEDRIALFHIALHKGSTIDELIAPSLKRLLENPRVIKTGVAVWRADGKRLRRYFDIHCQGLVELSNLHQVILTPNEEDITSGLRKLADQVKGILKLPLLKDEVRTSNWASELNDKQINYAADDAYAGYMLFRHMEARRSWMKPMRKRPEFAELEIPMQRQYNPTAASGGHHSKPRSKSTSRVAVQDSGVDSARVPPVKPEPTFDDDRDVQLYRALSAHRASSAQATQMASPRMLPSDTILKNITLARPADVEALQRVSGVGPARISAYGEIWLRIVSEHSRLWTTPSPAKTPSRGFRMPPEFPGYAIDSPQTPSRITGESPVYTSLFSALQSLRADLADDSRAKGLGIPGDDVLRALARAQPSERAALTRVSGSAEMVVLSTTCGVDLLAFIQRHVPQHDSTSPARRLLRLAGSGDDDEDDPAFEVMPDVKRRTSAGRWVV